MNCCLANGLSIYTEETNYIQFQTKQGHSTLLSYGQICKSQS